MKRYKFKIVLTILITIIVVIGWLVPFQYNNNGYCGEDALYRYKFGVYSCDLNEEAHPDFQCWRKMGGFWSYIGLKKLDCESKEHNNSVNNEINLAQDLDTLVVLESTLQSTFSNFKIIDYSTGDINKNKKNDFVVLIDSNGHRTVCLIETLTKNPLNLKIAKYNNNFIGCSGCGGAGVGDPYRGISINNGTITFKQLFGACCKDEETVIFTYDENLKNWFLLKKEKMSYCCNQEDDNEIKTVITRETKDDFGTVKFSEF